MLKLWLLNQDKKSEHQAWKLRNPGIHFLVEIVQQADQSGVVWINSTS